MSELTLRRRRGRLLLYVSVATPKTFNGVFLGRLQVPRFSLLVNWIKNDYAGWRVLGCKGHRVFDCGWLRFTPRIVPSYKRREES